MSGLARKIQQSRRCIFCGGGRLDREHFWPAWAAAILPNGRGLSYYDFASQYDRNTGQSHVTKHYRRQGAVTSKRLRVVCKTCNSGWMSRSETAVQPILTPMATGHDLRLTPEAQLILARWICMKTMTAEHNIIVEVVTEEAARRALMEHGAIPEGTQISLLKCGQGTWRSRYVRHAARLGADLSKDEDATGKNTQGVTFGFGDVVVSLFYTREPALDVGYDFAEGYALKIWPPPGTDLYWPPLPINVAGADHVAAAFDDLLDHPNVRIEGRDF